MSPKQEAGPKTSPANEDLFFGLFLLGMAILVFASTRKLLIGTSSNMGAGYFPQAIAWGMIFFGVFFVAKSQVRPSEKVYAPYWRGLFLIILAVAVFSLLLMKAGLVLAAFLAMLIASAASKETRPVEIVVYSALMSAASALLFVRALSMPMPIFPW
ncbi:MAG: tripartite tricarboxylate transporter TctB family protein [Candidatus Accumulibacter sp.]|nr:tripartite tricarboxylate transporter TctB family protein [Accumulibacter sp.]